jgi:SAM-dependent methyltransferase/tetratricopeptide (TPR) repeat protein
MNRRERRAATARGKPVPGTMPPGTSTLIAEATQAFGAGQTLRAEAICQKILAHVPAHAPSLNLLGLINQASGRDRPAIKMFSKAIAANEQDAACHYNIGLSYQRLSESAAAAAHFKKAIDLGLSGKDVDSLLMRYTDVAEGANRAGPLGTAFVNSDISDEPEIAKLAKNIFLQCALQSTLICSLPIERLLTYLRLALLRRAQAAAFNALQVEHDSLGLFCALAQQCFIGEYVFAQSADETAQANHLRELSLQLLSAGRAVPPVLLACVGAYFPLYALPGAQSLLTKSWPKCVADLLHQQVREPLLEADARRAIAALTDIDDAVSISVMGQYEENPYPRWTINPLTPPRRYQPRASESKQSHSARPDEILIAGCGTGKHAFDVAQQSLQSRILAVDLSRTSLAYARRKTREAGIGNIEYAQADILKLATVGRTFDRIESVGVLHHLADPKAGWRVLLSLLRPGGIIRVGLYSEAARSAIVKVRALISERGYAATPSGIRALRQAMISDPGRWSEILATAADFHSMSGCRDMFFNVVEHRFTIPQIAALLDDDDLSFLGFELDPVTVQKFQRQYPHARALTNLDHWHAFELANPDTFRRMYVFSVRKGERRQTDDSSATAVRP